MRKTRLLRPTLFQSKLRTPRMSGQSLTMRQGRGDFAEDLRALFTHLDDG